MQLLTDPGLRLALVAVVAMGLACALLSVFVVLRRWAFIGEGISHGGLGGAGTAWLLALLIPQWDQQWLVMTAVVLFCLLMAVGIGYFTRDGILNSDTVIGIFLVASVAWGFLAQGMYRAVLHREPVGFDTLVFGQMRPVSAAFTIAAVVACAGVIVSMWLFGKEIIAYSFDPLMAQVSGVRAGLMHYLMILLLTVMVLVGIRMLGSILVMAMLVLPGATALALSRRLGRVLLISTAVGLIGVVGGLGAHAWRRYLPVGPCIALALFAQFLIAYGVRRCRRATSINSQ